MAGISVNVSGSFNNTERFLQQMQKMDIRRIVTPLAQAGVSALASATPRDSGLAAHSWDYDIIETRESLTIWWTNSDIENGFPVVIGIQYGHATGTGGYVQGRDFINPTVRPIFDKIANEVWRVVTSA